MNKKLVFGHCHVIQGLGFPKIAATTLNGLLPPLKTLNSAPFKIPKKWYFKTPPKNLISAPKRTFFKY